MCTRPLSLLVVLAAFPSSSSADAAEDRIRALVLCDAERRWTGCPAPDPEDTLLELGVLDLVMLGPGHALARLRTACHVDADGWYNEASSVVQVRRGRVSLVPFAPRPDWAPDHPPGGNDEFVWNATLERDGDGVYLSNVMLMRGYGDSGSVEEYRWDGRRFVLFQRLHREGGAVFVRPGPFPIVAPEERQCRATLEFLGGRRARFVTYRGPQRSEHELILQDPGCSGEAEADSIECDTGTGSSGYSVYTVISRDADWVVLRMHDAGDPDPHEQEILRVPRHCAL